MKTIAQKKLTLFGLTWPIFIETLLHMFMGNADTLMLSHYSDNAVASVGVSNQIISMVIVMFGFVSAGTAILIAQNLGAKNNRTAKEISVVSIGINFLFGLVLSLIVFIFSEQMLKLMNLPIELFADANTYLKIIGSLSFVQALIMTIGAILRSNGFTRDAMYITIGMNILHIIGNAICLFGPFGLPVLGVEGIAWSTGISRIIALFSLGILLKKRIGSTLPYKMLFLFPKSHVKNLLKIGVPSAGEHLSYNGSQMAITFFLAMLGTEAITTKVYAQNIIMFIFLFSIAISQGTQILVGHMVGAKDFEGAYNRCMKSLKIAIVVSFLGAILFAIFSHQLMGLFTDNRDIIRIGSIIIFVNIILEPGRAFNLVIINSLRSAGDVRFPVYVGILSMWGVSVLLSYVFGITFGLGLIGIWMALTADEWLRGLIMLRRWKSRTWVDKVFVSSEKEESTG